MARRGAAIFEMARSGWSTTSGGELVTVPVFFSDIRSFTAISEKLKPEEARWVRFRLADTLWRAATLVMVATSSSRVAMSAKECPSQSLRWTTARCSAGSAERAAPRCPHERRPGLNSKPSTHPSTWTNSNGPLSPPPWPAWGSVAFSASA